MSRVRISSSAPLPTRGLSRSARHSAQSSMSRVRVSSSAPSLPRSELAENERTDRSPWKASRRGTSARRSEATASERSSARPSTLQAMSLRPVTPGETTPRAAPRPLLPIEQRRPPLTIPVTIVDSGVDVTPDVSRSSPCRAPAGSVSEPCSWCSPSSRSCPTEAGTPTRPSSRETGPSDTADRRLRPGHAGVPAHDRRVVSAGTTRRSRPVRRLAPWSATSSAARSSRASATASARAGPTGPRPRSSAAWPPWPPARPRDPTRATGTGDLSMIDALRQAARLIPQRPRRGADRRAHRGGPLGGQGLAAAPPGPGRTAPARLLRPPPRGPRGHRPRSHASRTGTSTVLAPTSPMAQAAAEALG